MTDTTNVKRIGLIMLFAYADVVCYLSNYVVATSIRPIHVRHDGSDQTRYNRTPEGL